MEFQAVWQKLDAALTSPVAIAEGPEHGGGVSAQRHGVRGWGRGSEAWDLELLDPVMALIRFGGRFSYAT